MKIARRAALALAIALPALMLLAGLLFALLLAMAYGFTPPPKLERGAFTAAQRETICGLFPLALAPGETISTLYFPGIMQDKGFLEISVHGAASREDFLARLHTEAVYLEPYDRYALFGTPGDFAEDSCNLTFREDAAVLFIGGYLHFELPGLAEIKRFLYEDMPPGPDAHAFIRDYVTLYGPVFLGGAAAEVTALAALAVLRRKARGSEGGAG